MPTMYRFKARSTTPGAYRLASGTLAQLISLGNIVKDVNRGDGGLGAYPLTATSKAEQLATDVAALEATGILGTFNETLRNVDPGTGNVKRPLDGGPVHYHIHGLTLIGTLVLGSGSGITVIATAGIGGLVAAIRRSGHTISLLRRTTGTNELGGQTGQLATIKSGILAWVQPISSELLLRYNQRNIEVTNSVYVLEDLSIVEGDVILFAGKNMLVVGCENQGGMNMLWRIDVVCV